MGNIHRLQWFDQQIREGKYPNSNHLLEQFEISKRQAQRDIEYLKDSLCAPLIYIARERGYGYEDETYVLPHLYMTAEEKKVLKYLSYRYAQYNYEDAPAIKRVAHLLNRFAGDQQLEGKRPLPIFESNPRIMQIVQMLTAAIEERSIVQLTYSQDGEAVVCGICPQKLISHYDAEYVIAYSDAVNKMERFRLDCIQYISITGQKFEGSINEAPHWEIDTLTRKPFIAKIQLTNPYQGKYWNGFVIRSVSGLDYEIEFYDMEIFIKQLLFSEWKELLSPNWLIQKVERRCYDVLARMRGEP